MNVSTRQSETLPGSYREQVNSSSTPTRSTVLECIDLSRSFSGTTVVDSLSFTLRAGEVLGFLGPNGAGKSTTVGMILGLIKPSKGSVHIAGEPLTSRPGLVAEHIGAIIENPAFYPYLSGRDNLRALAKMNGKVGEARITALLKMVNMDDRADRPYKTFSLGMKQRLGIAATLLTNPSIIILDEPTNGLDPAGQREVREVIPRLAEEGHAVLLASHLLNEVEQICNRVAIIRKGKLLQEGKVDDLLRGGNFIEVLVADPDRAAALHVLSTLPFVTRVEQEAGALRVIAPDDSGQAINRSLVEKGVFAAGITARRHSLEELFLDLTEGSAPEAPPA